MNYLWLGLSACVCVCVCVCVGGWVCVWCAGQSKLKPEVDVQLSVHNAMCELARDSK
jgi:hypothetical protein